jgi:hypothetical protein
LQRLKQIVGLVLLVLWVPITTHCALEAVPGLEFLKCANDTPANNQCNDDACSQLETATYKVSDTHAEFQLHTFIALLPLVVAEFPVDEQATAVIEAPPEISCSWQFSFRAALPPRAPSSVS